jgi:hypothetical protein
VGIPAVTLRQASYAWPVLQPCPFFSNFRGVRHSVGRAVYMRPTAFRSLPAPCGILLPDTFCVEKPAFSAMAMTSNAVFLPSTPSLRSVRISDVVLQGRPVQHDPSEDELRRPLNDTW